ncbi:MAG: biopolymer transport protein ExbB [Verrucomicrobiales bacterium]|jgi:biopolymer transport protein ExbB
MEELISKGGGLIWLLLGCSVLGLAVFVERYLHFHRSRISVSDLLNGLSNLIRKRNYAEAIHECAGTPGPVARVVHAAVLRHDAPREELKQIVQEQGQLEVPDLEKNLAPLRNIAYVAPMIGLLGTIIVLISTLTDIQAQSGYTTQTAIAAGLYRAMIDTAVGLVVAIPAFTLHAYLVSYSKKLMHDMERAGIEIVNIIHDSRSKRDDIVEFRQAAPAAAGEA